MCSVTERINMIKQPWGGYIKPSHFEVHKFFDVHFLNEEESISPRIVGMVVEYLTRFAMGAELSDAFKISCMGAKVAEKIHKNKNDIKKANKLLSQIKRIDEKSIINACKLVTYDVWYRNPSVAMCTKGANEIKPDEKTVQNIKIMIERSLLFWEKYGPIIKEGFSFEPSGYTKTICAGDGDFLTLDTIWDFKVSKARPTSKHTLQLLIYWIMGQHSGQEIFKNIKKIGIFNPRLNEAYLFDTDKIPKETICEIEQNVICY